MYASRKITAKERGEALADRRRNKLPWHSPPHFGGDVTVYLITAACWNHQPILYPAARRDEWQDTLLGVEADIGADLRAWVILPNHYHLLLTVELARFRSWIARKHNGKATQWNREDRTPGRAVWYRFMDRAIRSERHYFTTLNYIHGNPVKHDYVKDAKEWKWSSLHRYAEQVGWDTLRQWWSEYPVKDYGKGWDDE